MIDEHHRGIRTLDHATHLSGPHLPPHACRPAPLAHLGHADPLARERQARRRGAQLRVLRHPRPGTVRRVRTPKIRGLRSGVPRNTRGGDLLELEARRIDQRSHRSRRFEIEHVMPASRETQGNLLLAATQSIERDRGQNQDPHRLSVCCGGPLGRHPASSPRIPKSPSSA